LAIALAFTSILSPSEGLGEAAMFEAVTKMRLTAANLAGQSARVLARRQLQLPQRGRPAKYTKAKVEQMIRQAIASCRRKNYNVSPTLAKTANEMGMPVATLKKLMQRYELKYLPFKKETK
jgi:transcriptional regulator with GAF, ATPase, and Fis domain